MNSEFKKQKVTVFPSSSKQNVYTSDSVVMNVLNRSINFMKLISNFI